MKKAWSYLWMPILCVFACKSSGSNSSTADGEKGKQVPVVTLSTIDTVLYTDYIADIQAVKNVEVRSRLQGFLDQIYVDEGAAVTKGQILFKINDEEYRAEVSKAQAALNNAIADAKIVEVEATRVKALVDKNIISKTDLDVAQAQLNAAQARVQEARSVLQHAQTRLSFTNVRSPFNGRIDRIPLKVGSLLGEGALLTTVSDLQEVFAYFDISETEYLQNIASKQNESILAQPVKLTLADGQEYPYEGRVELAESEFEASTGSISLRARFPNPDRLLKHGATGKVKLPHRLEGALIVPQKAVFEIQDHTYVYVLADSNKVKMHSFEAGPRLGYFYLINSGLKAGQKIVYEGSQGLKDGATVRPRPVSFDSLLVHQDMN
ncbi:efflux RND transporter periplasmic adaptor subunit [Olivibacter sitiensis]|uniref:efflux RND transporter periplasmic adaptor subunit n=1 Tax=Olivibacter sitiensis TaxID=376470 RepID=UPI00055A46FC|nr:efflux RND transporter periplasmic adaptor subunit [Olivibacter sitiensis]